MQQLRIMTLDLRSPLSEDGIAFFAIDPIQAETPEPDAVAYIEEETPLPGHSLAAGSYLFVQIRGDLRGRELTECAVELQLEGLWRNMKLERTLVVRRLSEESGPVTQLMRPVSGSN